MGTRATPPQAERIAQTEPQTLGALRPIGMLAAAARRVLRGVGALLAGLGGALAADAG